MALILLQLTTKSIGSTEPETWQSIRDLNPGDNIVDVHVLTQNDPAHLKAIRSHHQGYNMERSRHFAVANAYSYILVVQSDIVFPSNTLTHLLEKMRKHDVGVLCPLTPERPEKVGTDGFVVEMSWNGNPHARKNIKAGKDFTITGNGSGYMCVLVRRDVFTKIGFPVMGNSDVNWYRRLHKAKMKIVCEVDLRIGHKQRSNGVIIRGDKYVVEHWRRRIADTEKKGNVWYHVLPGKWWYGKSKEQALEVLPSRIDEVRSLWSW